MFCLQRNKWILFWREDKRDLRTRNGGGHERGIGRASTQQDRASAYPMELHVEAAGIAHRLALSITAPQRGGGGLAVGTGEAHPAGSRLQHRKEVFLYGAVLGQNGLV